MLNFCSIAISESNGTRNTRNTRQRTDITVPLSGAGNGSKQVTSSKTTMGSPSMGNVLTAGQKYAVFVAADGMAVGESVPRMRMCRD